MKFSFHRGIDKLRSGDHGSTPKNDISAAKPVFMGETMRRIVRADFAACATPNVRRFVNRGEDGS